jgi:N-acetylglucosaminyldiphosphoundecaprenol N-acetyl-beta-D-mannosaminyltransferase
MGMPVNVLTERQAIDHILAALDARRGGWVITPNLDQLRLFRQRRDLRPMYHQADLVLADGAPLVWASRLQATPLPQRVAGSRLIHTLTAAAARAGRSVFLLGGGEPDTAALAARRLKNDNPSLRIASHFPPFGFRRNSGEMRRIIDALQATRPDIVFVGLGFPKQEDLIRALRATLPGAWFLGVGVSFSFVSGQIARAPVWIQRIGLEWVHRMCQEPERLFDRYLLRDMPYAIGLFANALAQRVR